MSVTQFPYPTDAHRLAALVAQERNLATLFPPPSLPPAPLSGSVHDLLRGRTLIITGAAASVGGRILRYVCYDPFTGGSVVRTPDQLRQLGAGRIERLA
jgi:hypothetical protein